jgi:hypothetical protein
MMVAVDHGNSDIFRPVGHARFPDGDQGDPDALHMVIEFFRETIDVNFRIDFERGHQTAVELNVDPFAKLFHFIHLLSLSSLKLIEQIVAVILRWIIIIAAFLLEGIDG